MYEMSVEASWEVYVLSPMVISVICRPSLDTDASSLSMSLCNRSSNVIVIDVLGTSPEGTVLLMTTLSGVKTSAVCSTSMDADPLRSPPTAKPPLTVKSSPACTLPVTYKKLFAPNPSLLMERLPLTMVTQFRGVFPSSELFKSPSMYSSRLCSEAYLTAA